MAQHEILMVVAAPLLVVGRPLVAFLWGLPFSWRRAAGSLSKYRLVAAVWSWLSRPLNAWWIHAVVLWGWHVPRAFEATLESDFVHSVQHVSFLGTALLFWWALIGGREAAMGYGKALLYVFSTGVHNSILGAWLTFSPVVWYPLYKGRTEAWSLTALEDQQLGGLIMWVPAGLVFSAGACISSLNGLRIQRICLPAMEGLHESVCDRGLYPGRRWQPPAGTVCCAGPYPPRVCRSKQSTFFQ
jgi:putative membrane protein